MTDLPRRARIFWPILICWPIADYISKRAVERTLLLHDPYRVIGDWVRFTLTYNTGAAMDISLGSMSRPVFAILAVFMVGVVITMYRHAGRDEIAQPIALALIGGGALGNLLDRIRSARGVVDFIDVGVGNARFWTFNVADAGVTCGAILLVLLLWRAPAETNAPAATPR